MTKELLLQELEAQGVLKNPLIREAFYAVDRADFVSSRLKNFVYLNQPLEIGLGQTISQPYTVAFMLDLLDPKPGEKILDVGSGSGWQTALLAYIVSRNKSQISNSKSQNLGRVFAVERIKELFELGKKNVEKYSFLKNGIVKMYCQDGSRGLPEEAPFDKIIAAASARGVPEPWKDQLRVGGRLVAPVGDKIIRLMKKSDTEFFQEDFYGFVFVPLIY